MADTRIHIDDAPVRLRNARIADLEIGMRWDRVRRPLDAHAVGTITHALHKQGRYGTAAAIRTLWADSQNGVRAEVELRRIKSSRWWFILKRFV